jgi:TonB family protein
VTGNWVPGDRLTLPQIELAKEFADPAQGWDLRICVGAARSCFPSPNLLLPSDPDPTQPPLPVPPGSERVPGEGLVPDGAVYSIGNGVSQPSILKKVEPQYTEEARKAKWQGTVSLLVVIDETGKPRVVKVIKQLGLGLDESAIKAVEQWRFKPGMKDGKPVAVDSTIEVTFLLPK